ncbi:MAG: DUF2914 domain-containing protein [Balneolaceae bacterium]|nr:DUF2914 domain-containing protein [Balneolaceae bacterium]
MMKKLIATALFITFTVLAANAQSLSVETIEFGTSVENRKIVNADSVFSNSIERVYCFTEVSGSGEATTITHVWYMQDKEMARVKHSGEWRNHRRTWSSKYILEDWTGEWSVDVLNSDGKVLATKTFRVESAVADQ